MNRDNRVSPFMKKARSQAQSEEAHVSMRKEKRKKEIQLLASHGDFYSSMSFACLHRPSNNTNMLNTTFQ
jgi:hypothetical protein